MHPAPDKPSRNSNPFTRLLVNLYDRTAFHWIVSAVAAPVYTVMGACYRLLNRVWPIRLWQDWQSRPTPGFPLPLAPHDLPVKPQGCDGCGSYVGTLIGTYVDAGSLAALLPPGTSLDPHNIHDGRHALVLLFGYMEDLHFAWSPLRGMNYLECGVAVPHIRLDDGIYYVSRFFYIPLLHLNRLYPVILGWIVGYRKKWSRIRVTETTYSIKSLFAGKPILDAEFTRVANPDAAQAGHWKDLLEEPHLNPFGRDKLFLHFHWDWPHAELQPVEAKVVIHQDLPGLPAGTYNFKGIDAGEWQDGMAPQGAMRLATPFELLLPFSLRRLRAHRRPPEPAGSAPPA